MNYPIISEEYLNKYANKIFKIVGEKQLNAESVNAKTVQDYYTGSSIYYRTFHSPDGAMHLPIEFSRSEKHKDKLLYQAKSVKKIIEENNYREVLELGCGMGFNSGYLASQLPNVNFTAVDLTEDNIRRAKKKHKEKSNLNFLVGNFDKAQFGEKKYDLVFAIETLCHSADVVSVIASLKPFLNPGGRIIIYDGYINPETPELTKEITQAHKMISWGFAMNSFQELKEIINSDKLQGFKINELKDYTPNILPNYRMILKGSSVGLTFPLLLKFLIAVKLVSPALIKQFSAGIFGYYLLQEKYLGYYKLELLYKS